MLKDKDNGDVLFVVVFSLIRKENLEREEAKAAEKTKDPQSSGSEDDSGAVRDFQPGADDVD